MLDNNQTANWLISDCLVAAAVCAAGQLIGGDLSLPASEKYYKPQYAALPFLAVGTDDAAFNTEGGK